jgi:hypothetical protein
MALEILTYLAQTPDAQDTFDGILQWWAVERSRPRNPREVRAAVDELVSAGFLVATRGRDQQERYRMNAARRADARALVDAHRGGKDH